MRKVLKIIIILLLMVAISIIHVEAASGNVTLVQGQEKVQVGNTFTVSINVTCNTLFEGLTGKLTYDKTKLQMVKVENAQGITDLNSEDVNGDYIITLFPSSANAITSATCQTITFKVLENVSNNEQLNIGFQADMKDGDEQIKNISSQISVKVNEDITLTSTSYLLDDTREYLSNIDPDTTVETLINNITTNAAEVKVFNGNKEVSLTDKIGTGAIVILKNNYDEKTYTLIVKGDADGNGKADFWDMLAINKHRLGVETLGEIEALAGDVTKDGETNFWDMLEINKFRLGLNTTL